MAELKFPDFAGETGAQLNTAGTPYIDLSASSAATNHRTFANAASDTNIDFDDGDTIAVDIIDTSGNTATWTATWASGTSRITRVSLEAAQGTLLTSAGAITVYASVPGRWFLHSTLSVNAQTPVSTDITGAVGQYYYITQSSQSADIDLTLPSANVGDRIGVYMVDGDNTYEVIIKGAASQTINGGSAATEWSRLFIKGENCIFRCTAANTWIVEHDGRKPQSFHATADGSTYQSIPNITFEKLDDAVNTEQYDIGSCYDTTSGKCQPRRLGKWNFGAFTTFVNIADGKKIIQRVHKYNSSDVSQEKYEMGRLLTGGYGFNGAGGPAPLEHDTLTDYFVLEIYHDEGLALDVVNGAAASWFSGKEILE